MSHDLKISPLGGVREIGSNLTLIELEQRYVCIDMGIRFPALHTLGINQVSYNLDYLPKDRPLTLIITHGHEDHIGAVTLFLKRFPDCEVHAPKFAALLLQNKGIEIDGFHIYKEAEKIKLDELEVTPLRIPHSIPDTFFLGMKWNEFALFFSSDFRFYRPEQSIQLKTKLDELNLFGQHNLLFADSTNALVAQHHKNEDHVKDELQSLLAKEHHNIFACFFPSNITRFQSFLEAALKTNRSVKLIGRSVREYYEVANKNQLLGNLPNSGSKNLYLISGSQGDAFSGMYRLAYNELKDVKYSRNDLFLYSAKCIPGNEEKVFSLFNKIVERGIELISSATHPIHTSGHASMGDIKTLAEITRCTHFYPIHGEAYMLQHAHRSIKESYPQIATDLIYNSDSIILKESHEPVVIKSTSNSKNEWWYFDRNLNLFSKHDVRSRKKLAKKGMIAISLNRSLTDDPIITSLGLPQLSTDFERHLQSQVKEHFPCETSFVSGAKSNLISSIKKLCQSELKYKPLILIHIHP